MTYTRSKETNRSSIEMLRSLPAVFGLKDVMTLFDMPSNTDAMKAITRWKAKGWAVPFGPRAGIYFNRYISPDHDDRKTALDKLLRLPFVVIGMNAIRHGGWTTQRGGEIEIAVPVTASIQTHPKAYGILFCPRSPRWFDKIQDHVSTPNDGIYGLPTLTPEYALADILLSKAGRLRKDKKVWDAPPDDILPEIDDPADVIQRCLEAADTMGVSRQDMIAFLSEVEHLQDDIDEVASASLSP